MRPPNFPTRLVLSLVIASVIYTITLEPIGDRARQACFDLGARVGCMYNMPGILLVGENGPFFADSPCDRFFNFLWRHAPWAAPLLTSYSPFLILELFLSRRRRFTPGVTRCGRCSYPLSGLAKPQCPECGAVI